MYRLFSGALLCACLSVAAHAAGTKSCPPALPTGTTIVGRVEKVGLEEAGINLVARIDTGAGLSSLDARDIKVYKDKNGKERVRFEVTVDGGKDIVLSRPLVEWVNIKLKASKKTPDGGFTKRPVVRMDLCLGGKVIDGRVNLADRSHMLYPLLVGRNTLKTADFLVDVRKKFTHKPRCD